MTWPLQPDGKKWCLFDPFHYLWAIAEGQWAERVWLGIDLDPRRRCLDGIKYEVVRGETMEIIWGDNFEGDFYFADDPYAGKTKVSELEIPVGWMVQWVQDRDGNVRPEWKPRRPPQREVIGLQSAGVHTSSAKHYTVLYRHMEAEIGKNYQLRAAVLGDAKGHYAIGVGVDPFGGDNFESVDVRWGWWGTWDNDWKNQVWKRLMTTITAAHSERITLYLCSWQRHAQDGAAVFDEVELWAEEGTTPPGPTPQPGEVDYARIQAMIDDGNEQLMAEVKALWMSNLAAQLQNMTE